MGDGYYGNYPQPCGFGWNVHANEPAAGPGDDVFIKKECIAKRTLPSLFAIKVVCYYRYFFP